MTAVGLQPREMLEVRASLLRLLRSPLGAEWWHAVQARIPIVRPAELADQDPVAAASALLDAEIGRLAEAELLAVTPEMTELVTGAATTLPGYRLHPDDLPAPTGLCGYGVPVGLSEEASPVVLVLWGARPDGVWISHYTQMSSQELTELERDVRRRGGDVQVIRQLRPYGLSYDSEVLLPWGEAVAFDTRTPSGVDIGPLIRGVMTTWLVMSEPYVAEETIQPDRATRRRLAAAGEEAVPTVRLSTLRAARIDRSVRAGDHQHHHRWLVRGHWRRHWYPSRHEHRPRWIAPHLAGPEGAPLLGGERVHVLRR